MVTKLGYNISVFQGARALLESHHVGMDLIMCMLGPIVASGNFRDVYSHAIDPTKVLKVEYGHEKKEQHDSVMQNSFCNIQEFLLWREIEGLKGRFAWVKEWFAPVEWISPSGHVLCMQKTEQLPDRKRPDRIPEFLWDVKQENFGWIEDNFVCHDYAHVSALITYEKKMQKVKDYWK